MVRVIRSPRAAESRARIILFSVVSVGVLMFGIVGMHAGMAGMQGHAGPEHRMMAAAPVSVDVTAAAPTATDLMQSGMGGMSAMDCLMLGMMCVFGAIAVVLLFALSARLQTVLRRRLLVRGLAAITGLRPPEAPSLLVLSISRT